MLDRLILAVTSKAGLGALFLLACAAVTFSQVSQLRMGRPDAMGPGYFPALLGGLFLFFAVILLVEGWRNPDQRVHLGPLRPVIFLLGAIVLFGLLYPRLGGIVAMTVLITLSAFAETGRSLREVVLLCTAVVVMVWVIFVLALGLQLTMLPPWIQS